MMADLISRDAAIEAMRECWRRVYQFAKPFEVNRIMDCIKAVKELPAVDAVPVVRCRDCMHCFSVESDPLTPYDGESAWYCDQFDFDVDVLALDPCRFYCADGERRDEDAAD